MNNIQSLIKRADKYLKSSKILIKARDFESSVSRTYYAIFFTTEVILLTKKMTSSSHKGVISLFNKHFIKTEIISKEVGKTLNIAFDKRQLSDYEFSFIISE